jgi:hypothetical protein
MNVFSFIFLDLDFIRLSYHALIHCCFSFYCTYPEMEFLDINLTKDSSLLLHAIHSPFMADFKENHTLLWFEKSLQKIRETKNLESIHEQHFCRTEKLG